MRLLCTAVVTPQLHRTILVVIYSTRFIRSRHAHARGGAQGRPMPFSIWLGHLTPSAGKRTRGATTTTKRLRNSGLSTQTIAGKEHPEGLVMSSGATIDDCAYQGFGVNTL